MYYYGGDHMGAGAWVFVGLICIVVVGLLLAFVVWLVQEQRRLPHVSHYLSGTASEILDRRLAAGEISVQEYERVKASLAAPPRDSSSSEEPPPTP